MNIMFKLKNERIKMSIIIYCKILIKFKRDFLFLFVYFIENRICYWCGGYTKECTCIKIYWLVGILLVI